MKNKKKILIIVGVLLLISLVITYTYSLFVYNKTSTNSKLIVGDVYMHYNEDNEGIVINDMTSIGERYTLNTSDEAINTCVEYLYNTYGENWHDLYYDYPSNPAPTSDKYNDIKANFMSTTYNNSYSNYCAGYRIMEASSHPQNFNQSEVVVTPISIPETGIYIMEDFENGVLTEADKTYFLENNIIIDNFQYLPYFEFSITGKNTHTKNSILYNIGLVKGDIPSGKTEVNRIQDKFLRFKLVKVENSEEIVLKDNLTIEDINGNSIYSNYISSNTNTEISHTYRLFAWFDNNIVVGNTERSDYSFDEWNNLFASIKVKVNGAYTEGENFVEKVKSRYNVNTKQDGLVAVNTSGDLATAGDTIREYRYSGIGNYCTYTDGTNDYNLSVSGTTCPTSACLLGGKLVMTEDNDVFILMGGTCSDQGGTTLSLKNGQTTPTDSGLRNYVIFNNEMWRIVGIFNEENASGVVEERIKLVKDEPISLETEVEETITKNGVTYNTFNLTTGTKYKYFYWNYPTDDSTYSSNLNDWTKAGSQYYLNEIYYNSLSNNNLIEEMKYYLGWLAEGTLKEIYEMERTASNVIENNQASWNGKIALLYPSDLGYARATSGWSDSIIANINYNNWLLNDQAAFWLLSPFDGDADDVAGWDYGYGLSDGRADGRAGLRPVLSLGSQTLIGSGTGSYEDPYQLMG